MEGAQVGVQEGLGIDDGMDDYKKEYTYALILQMFGIDGRNYSFPPFCMIYNAPAAAVHSAIESALPLMGNPVKEGRPDFGVFGVGFMDREHASPRVIGNPS